MVASIKAWFLRESSMDGRLAIFADAWAFIFDPEARILHKPGMSVREARVRRLIAAPYGCQIVGEG